MKKNENESKTILGSPELAMKRLGCGRNRMYEDLLKRSDFPAFKMGSKYFVNLSLLENWVEKQCYKK
jgi:hypothetical protein